MTRSGRTPSSAGRRADSLQSEHSWWTAADAWFNRLLAGGARGLTMLAVAALVSGLIGVMAINFVGQLMQGVRLDRERARLQSDIAELRRENDLLHAQVDFTAGDTYVEQQIRAYGYARDGDVVLIAERNPTPPADDTGVDQAAAVVVETPVQGANWLRWWLAVFP